MKVRIIKTDGTESVIECNPDQIGEKIGAEMLDTVNLHNGRIMLVDDNGYENEAAVIGSRIELIPVRPKKSVNVKATNLYHNVCKPGTTYEIVGDVAIVNDVDYRREI